MHIKTAQMKIDNHSRLRLFRTVRSGRHIYNDALFGKFMLSLQKVHEAVKSGMSLEDALSFFSTNSDRIVAQEFIGAISEGTFAAADWNDLAGTIIFYRNGGTLPSEEGAQTETERPKVKILPGARTTSPEEPAEEEGEFAGLEPDQVEYVRRFQNMQYPEDEASQKKAADYIQKIIDGFKKLNQFGLDLRRKKQIKATEVTTPSYYLKNLHKEWQKQQEAVEVPAEEEATTETPEEAAKPEEEEEVTGESLPVDAEVVEVDGVEKQKEIILAFPSELTDSQAVRLLGFDLTKNYVSIQDDSLEVDYSAFNEAYTVVRTALQSWSYRSKESIREKPNGRGVYAADEGVKKELNDIAYAIKVFDTNILNKTLGLVNQIDEAILAEQDKAEVVRLRAAKSRLERQVSRRVQPLLMSSRISDDPDFVMSIVDQIVFVSSVAAYNNSRYIEQIFFETSKDPANLTQDEKKNETFKSAFSDIMLNKTSGDVNSKFRSFFEILGGTIRMNKARDIVSYMNIQQSLFYTDAKSKARKKVSGVHKFKGTSCPVCHRYIEFHTGSTYDKADELHSGYKIAIYAPYGYKNRMHTFLPEESFKFDENGSERTFTPPGEEYVAENDLQNTFTEKVIRDKIDSSSKTWDEIQSMINSGTFTIQREGYLRRSEAFRLMGAKKLKVTNINSTKFMCPIGVHKVSGDSNTCGISYNKPDSATRSYQLQPSWNGERASLLSASGGTYRIYQNEKFSPNWGDESLEESARAKAAGGYNFSKTLFGCPCHIHSPDTDDSNMYLEHNNLAFRISDDQRYSPPTKPNGSFAELEEGTAAYLVCSANVSLSSVDRDPSSDTYILKELKKIHNTDVELFVKLIEFLIKNGYDEVEIMRMMEDLDSISVGDISKISSPHRKRRISMLEDILLKKTAVFGLDTYSLIKNLTLVCPFGHKFTIEQSLRFGESHSSFVLNNKEKFAAFVPLMIAQGPDSVALLMDFMEPLDSSLITSTAYYDDWIKLKSENRRLNYFKTRRATRAKVTILKFNINGQDYVFNDKIEVKTDVIWFGNKDRVPDTQDIGRSIAAHGEKRVKNTDDAESALRQREEGNTDEDESVFATGKDGEEVLLDWEDRMSKSLEDAHVEEDTLLVSVPIPGGSASYRNPSDLAGNINSISRALKASLSIVDSWTNNLIYENFTKSLAKSMVSDREVEAVAKDIFVKNILPKIEFTEYPGEDPEKDKEEYVLSLQNIFISAFSDNAKIVSLIREGDLDKAGIARKIISDSVDILFAKSELVDLETIEGDLSAIDGSKIAEEALTLGSASEAEVDPNDFTAIRSNRRQLAGSQENKDLVDKITALGSESRSATVGADREVSKLPLLSYALFISHTLAKMKNLYFDRTSPLYIGVDIMPEGLATVDDIMTITSEQIESIKDDWTSKSIFESDKTIFYSRESLEDENRLGHKYVSMINKAYRYLDLHIKNARQLVINPRAINYAREYAITSLADQVLYEYLEENPDIDMNDARERVRLESEKVKAYNRISSYFPIINPSFSDMMGPSASILTKKYDDSGRLINASRVSRFAPYLILPYIHKTTSSGGGVSINFDHEFYSDMLVETDHETGKKVLTSSSTNYNSGKMQVGFMTNSTRNQWPLPRFGFYGDAENQISNSTNHVGFWLPFPENRWSSSKSTTSISTLKDLPISNINAVASVPYQDTSGDETQAYNFKLNIGFLLERGFSRERYRMTYHLIEEFNNLNSLRADKKSEYDLFESTAEQKRERLETELSRSRRILSRMTGNSPTVKMNRRKTEQTVAGLERELSMHIEKQENLPELRRKLESWYESQLLNIQTQYSNLPYEIHTKKEVAVAKDIQTGIQALKDGGFSSQRKKAKFRPKPDRMLRVGLADPITAYHLIQNPEIHGSIYSHMGDEYSTVSENVIKAALLDFIVRIYNLDEIARIFVSKNKRALIEDFGEERTLAFSGIDLLTETIKKRFADESRYKTLSATDLGNLMPGRYYDIDTDNSSISMHYDQSLDPGRYPDYKALNLLAVRVKNRGLARPPVRSDENDIKTVSSRAADAMDKYIKQMTTAGFEDSEHYAEDQELQKSSKYFEKFVKRSNALERIMRMQAASIIDPFAIIG